MSEGTPRWGDLLAMLRKCFRVALVVAALLLVFTLPLELSSKNGKVNTL
jgi:hypothetical protein